MITTSLGNIGKPMVFFDSPYGNLQAVKALHSALERMNIPPERIICTGDLVGYFAQPEETVRFIKKWGIHSISGDFDQKIIDGAIHNDFLDEDSEFTPWTHFVLKELSNGSKKWMKKLPPHIDFMVAKKKITVVHGTFSKISEPIFLTTPWKRKKEELKISNSDIIISGHSGTPFMDIYTRRAWINTGSLGLPANDGTPEVWYLLMTPHTDGSLHFEHRRLEYNFEKAALLTDKMKLNFDHSQTLRTGRWAHKTSLPFKEANIQGRKLELNPVTIPAL